MSRQVRMDDNVISEIETLGSLKAETIRAEQGLSDWQGITYSDVMMFCIKTVKKYYKLGDA